MLDICNGNSECQTNESRVALLAQKSLGVSGNFGMCKKPTNPFDYLDDIGISTIWRFILSHPDMDHMDGLDTLFDSYTVNNYWDSGVRREKSDFGGSPYNEDDWDRYESLIAGDESGTTTLLKRHGAKFEMANKPNGGDGLHILAPDKKLVDEADDDTNDASYVMLYESIGGKILMPGDGFDFPALSGLPRGELR